jgi:hypothetical protein
VNSQKHAKVNAQKNNCLGECSAKHAKASAREKTVEVNAQKTCEGKCSEKLAKLSAKKHASVYAPKKLLR